MQRRERNPNKGFHFFRNCFNFCASLNGIRCTKNVSALWKGMICLNKRRQQGAHVTSD